MHRLREARVGHIYQTLLAALEEFHDEWDQKAFPKLEQQAHRYAPDGASSHHKTEEQLHLCHGHAICSVIYHLISWG